MHAQAWSLNLVVIICIIIIIRIFGGGNCSFFVIMRLGNPFGEGNLYGDFGHLAVVQG